MPIYMKLESANKGTITQNTGSEDIAGRNSFTSAPASADHTLVYDWGFEFEQPHNSSFGGADHSQAALETKVWFKLPAYHSITALTLNVVNAKDKLTDLNLVQIDRVGSSKGQVTSTSSFKDGIITKVFTEQGDQRDPATKGRGTITIEMKFENYTHECKVSKVTGDIKTTNAG